MPQGWRRPQLQADLPTAQGRCQSHSSRCQKQPSTQRSAPLPSCPGARTDVLGAGVAVLGVEGLEAAAAVGSAILHDVPLPPQHRLAFKAAEVLHVPVSPFGLGAFVGKNDLGRGKRKHGVQLVRGDLGRGH